MLSLAWPVPGRLGQQSLVARHSTLSQDWTNFHQQPIERPSPAQTQSLQESLNRTDKIFANCCKILLQNNWESFPLDTYFDDYWYQYWNLKPQDGALSSLIFFQVKKISLCDASLGNLCGSAREHFRDQVHFSSPLHPLNSCQARVRLRLSFQLSWVAGSTWLTLW